MKSLKANLTSTSKNEQKALTECSALNESLKEMNALRLALQKKENDVKNLDGEVGLYLTLTF